MSLLRTGKLVITSRIRVTFWKQRTRSENFTCYVME